MVGLARLAPVVLLPIFYEFAARPRRLVERLMALATRAGAPVVGVFEWVLSGHTRKANAALAGIGRTRRILLSDTLLADYSEDEIEVVLAHELAHHVHRDLWRGMALQAASLFGGFYVADVVAARACADRLGAARPVRSGRRCRCCCWSAARCRSCCCRSATRCRARRSGAADRYALATTRNVDAFVTAMKRLSQQNLAEEYPSPLVRWLFYSHPPIRERIDAARAFARRGDHHAA